MARKRSTHVEHAAGDVPNFAEGYEALMVAPKGATSVTYKDNEYTVENGYIVVPIGAVGELESHGYKVPEEGGGVPDAE